MHNSYILYVDDDVDTVRAPHLSVLSLTWREKCGLPQFTTTQKEYVHNPNMKWRKARSYEEAIQILDEFGCPVMIFLDHDLGEGKTGYDLIKEIVNRDIERESYIPCKFEVYSQSNNIVGRRNRLEYISGYMQQR